MHIHSILHSADFLGYIVYPHYRLVRRRVVGNLRERLQAFQDRYVKGLPDLPGFENLEGLNYSYRLALETEALAELRATLASYWGHFKHADSARLCAALFRQYPWLGLLFDEALQPRWQPSAQSIVGYKSQLWFFRRQYPEAELHVQRGTELDKIPPPDIAIVPTLCVGMPSVSLRRCGTLSVPDCIPTQSVGTIITPCVGTINSVPYPADSLLWVTRVIIREQGYHLKNGLKCRVATRLFTQPGVSLCPYAKK